MHPVEPPIATPETLIASITARSSLGLDTSTLSLIHEYSRCTPRLVSLIRQSLYVGLICRICLICMPYMPSRILPLHAVPRQHKTLLRLPLPFSIFSLSPSDIPSTRGRLARPNGREGFKI